MKKVLTILLIIIFNSNTLFSQNNQDTLSIKSFEVFYNDFFIHVDHHVGKVQLFALIDEHLWSGAVWVDDKGNEAYLLKNLLNEIEKDHANKVDSANFKMNEEDKRRDYMYQQYLHNRIVSVRFDGGKYKIIAYDVK